MAHEVIVANPRRVKAISDSRRKNDRVDAAKLAKLARFDPELLLPIHGLINEARGQVKALGYRLESCDADKLGPEQAKNLPEEMREALALTLERRNIRRSSCLP